MSNADDDLSRGLQHPLLALQLPARARAVCAQHGLTTVAQFLAMPRAQFLALPGCGERTYLAVERRVARWLARTFGQATPHGSSRRSILPLLPSRAAERAMQALSIRTVGEFLSTPRDRILAQPGFGRRTYQRIVDAIERTEPQATAVSRLLPPALRSLELRGLPLPAPIRGRIEELGCATFGAVLGLPEAVFDDGGELGPEVAESLASAIEQLIRVALEQIDTRPLDDELDWPQLLARLLQPLRLGERRHLRRRLGIDTHARTPRELALSTGSGLEEILRRDRWIRNRLHERAPALLCRLRHEVQRELEAFEGVVRPDRLAVRSLLQVVATGSGDPDLPLRLIAFCFPDEFHDHGGFLSALPRRTARRFTAVLRQATMAAQLPRPLAEIEASLRQVVDPVPRGLLLHMLQEVLRLRLHIDATQGELVLPPVPPAVRRLADLLHEEGKPLQIEELVFCYRERFRTARRHRLEGHLRRDPLFLEVDQDTWSLRSRHTEQIAAVAALAEQVATSILGDGGRHAVQSLLPEADRHRLWFLLDALRRDPRLRYLGRGEFCPATQHQSTALRRLLQDFRRAAGEVVFSRFVGNQPKESRRLVERLLAENRAFVFPCADRIDVLTNYPYNDERLDQLNRLVDGFLQLHHGYARIEAVQAAVNETDLGGGWLTTTLLGEILRRNGPFEVLPGGIVAQRSLGLGGWLLQRARHVLREAGVPVSVEEILAERPELTEFRDSIGALLQHDPLIQTPDGARFLIT